MSPYLMEGTGAPCVSLLFQLLRELTADTDYEAQHALLGTSFMVVTFSSVCILAQRLRVPKCAAMLTFLVAFFAPVCDGAVQSASSTLFTCSWGEVSSGTDCLARTLQIDGAVAITGVPGISRARSEAFRNVARCLHADASNSHAHILGDGTIRRTIGARTFAGVAEPIVCGSDDASVQAATDSLRALIDAATRRFTHALEPLVVDSSKLPASASSLTQLVLSTEHLEHFHSYATPNRSTIETMDLGSHRPESRAPNEMSAKHPSVSGSIHGIAAVVDAARYPPPTLPMHVDAGLFVAIVPALYTDALDPDGDLTRADDAQEPDFFVRRGDGAQAYLPSHLALDSLIFVLGDGWRYWINPALSMTLRAAPHSVVLRPSAATIEQQRVRLWHGRMVLPPSQAVMPNGGDFASWKRARFARGLLASTHRNASGLSKASTRLAEVALPTGCAGGAPILTADDGCETSAGAAGVMCWMQCMSVDDLPCGQEAQCYDTRTETLDPNCQDMGAGWCKLECQKPPSPSGNHTPGNHTPLPGSLSGAFCDSGALTDMSMSGFFWGSDGRSPCIMLLFESFSLDTPSRFALGVIITLLMCLIVEAMTCFRRYRLPSIARCRPKSWAVLSVASFAAQTGACYLHIRRWFSLHSPVQAVETRSRGPCALQPLHVIQNLTRLCSCRPFSLGICADAHRYDVQR